MYDGTISPFADVRVTQAFMQLVEHAAVEAQENLSNVAHANCLNQRGGGATTNTTTTTAPVASQMREEYDASTSEHGACRTSSGRSMMHNQHGAAHGNMGGGGGTCAACSTGSSISQLAHPHQQLSAADVLRRFVAGVYDRPTSQFYSGAAASVFMADLQSLIHTVPTTMAGGSGGGRSLAGAAEMVLRAFPATAPSGEGGTSQRPPSTAGGGKHPITSPNNTAVLSGTLTSAAQTTTTAGAGSPFLGRTAADFSITATSQHTMGSPTGTTPKDPPASTYHFSSCPTVAVHKDAEFLLVEREDEKTDTSDPLLATAPVITAQVVQGLIRAVIGKFTGAAYHAASGTWIGSVPSPFSDASNTPGFCRGGGCGGVGNSPYGNITTSGVVRSASQSPIAGRKAHKVVAQVDTSDDDADASITNPIKGGIVRSLSTGRGGSGTSPNFQSGGGPDAHRGGGSGASCGGTFPFLALPPSELLDWEEPDTGFHLVVTSLLQDVGEFCLDECLSDSQAQQVLLCVDALLQTIMEAHTGSDVIDCDEGEDFHMALVGDVRRCMEECVAAMTLEGDDSESESERSDRSDDEEETFEDETSSIGTKEVTIVRRQPTYKTVEERQIRPESLQAWMSRRSAIIDGVSGGGHRASMSPVQGGNTANLGASTTHHLGVGDGDDPGASIGESAMGASTNLTAADLDPSQLPTLPAPTTYSHLNAASRKALIAHDDTLLQLPAMVVHRRVRLVEEVPQTITIYSNIPWGTAIGFLKLVQRCVLPNLPLFAFCLQPSEVALDAIPWLDGTLAETEYLPESVHVSGMEQVLIAPIVEDVPPGLVPPMGNVHAYALSRAVPGSYVPPCPTTSREQALQHLHQLLASLDATFDDRESVATTIAPAAASGGRNSARGAKKGGAKAKDTGGGAVMGLAGITLPGGGTLGMGVSETGSTYNLLDGSSCNPFLAYLANAAQQQQSSSSPDTFLPHLPTEEPPLPLDVFTAYHARLAFVADVEGTLSTLYQTTWSEPLLSYFTAQFEPVQNDMIDHERQVRAEDRAAALSKKDYVAAAEVAEHRLKRSVVISPQSPLRGAAGHGTTSEAVQPVADLANESPRQSRGGKGSKKGGPRLSLTSASKVSMSASQQGTNLVSSDNTTPSNASQPTSTTAHVEPSALETFLLETTERLVKLERHVEVVQSPPTSAPPVIGRGGKQPTAPQRATGGKASAGRR